MEITRLIGPTENGRYILELSNKRYFENTLERIIKYYCKHSKDYVVTFEVDNGSRHFSIAVDYLWYETGTPNLIYHLMRNNITGIIAHDLDEAHAIKTEIEKGYMWELLKE